MTGVDEKALEKSTDRILEVLAGMSEELSKLSDKVDNVKAGLEKRIDRLEAKVKAGEINLARKIDDLKAELFDAPTKKELADIELRVERLERAVAS